ncbi:hypothetical protein K7432_008355 [Basidiobolus ranarum]|uniref:Uncharacterized protein n=1 Tax=Basidiobolus ranarum TaxID=34480 RepID=A0ABR2VZ48_9FUNG
MKSIFIIALTTFSLVAAQVDNFEIQECLSHCDQESPQWVACASECVGLPHPDNINNDENAMKKCVNDCQSDDTDCENTCISSHSEDGNIESEQSSETPTSVTSTSETNQESITSSELATQTSAATQTSTTASQSTNSMNTIASSPTPSTRVGRNPVPFVPQLNESFEIRASLSAITLAITVTLRYWVL